jgi:hypothetical protein
VSSRCGECRTWSAGEESGPGDRPGARRAESAAARTRRAATKEQNGGREARRSGARVFQERAIAGTAGNAQPSWSARRRGSRPELERSRAARAGDRAVRNDEGVQRSGVCPRFAGGSVAPTPRGEPAVSRSEGPCGPSAGSEATGAEAEGGAGRSVSESGDERDTDPPAWRRLRAPRQPMGAAGSPPGWNTGAARARSARLPARVLQERRFVRATAPQRPPPAGSLSYRTERSGGGSRRRDGARDGAPCAARIFGDVANGD